MKPRLVTIALSALAIFGSLVWAAVPRAGVEAVARNDVQAAAPAGAKPADGANAAAHGRPAPSATARVGGRPSSDRFVGSDSCAASNCHGGVRRNEFVCDEYGRWLQFDRHATAWETLDNEVSRQIAEKLKLLTKDGEPNARSAAECLGCHSTGSTNPPKKGEVLDLVEGVSCEDCHGAARDWLKRHHRGDWKSMTAAAKATLGFNDTKNLAVRGRVCAGCHVGGPNGDVNHDLIAAGHPRMLFEFSSFQELMAPHWNLAAEETRTPHRAAGLWAVGQLTTAETALRLLDLRASSAAAPPAMDGSRAPWPEFSEYACASCHHNLRLPATRAERGPPFRPGDFVWGPWTFALRHDAEPLKLHSDGLKAVFSERPGEPDPFHVLLSRPRVRPAHVAGEARRLADLLAKDADRLSQQFAVRPDPDSEIPDRPLTDAEIRRWFDRLANPDAPRDDREWESIARHYLALTAVARSLSLLNYGDVPIPRRSIRDSLEEFRGLLLRPYRPADLPADAAPEAKAPQKADAPDGGPQTPVPVTEVAPLLKQLHKLVSRMP